LYTKKEIMPKVMVYRDALTEVDDLFEIIKNSESIDDSSLIIEPWGIWRENSGSTNGLFSKIKTNGELHGKKDGSLIEKQQYVNQVLIKLVRTLLEDYLNMWSTVGTWEHVKSFKNLELCEIDLLKYNKTDIDKKYALYYHTDLKEETSQSRGYKQILTFTIYLNDNYEGGEISYIDEVSQKLITYKPKKGDVTVFPSGPPYFHGVRPITDNSKYLARTFFSCWYEGSPEWLENEKIYGAEEWAKVSLENEAEQGATNIYNRIPLMVDEEYPEESPKGYQVFRYTEEIGFEF